MNDEGGRGGGGTLDGEEEAEGRGGGGGRSSWGERSSDCFTTPSRVGEVDMLIGKWTREILRKEGSRIASGRKEGDVGRREGRGDASSSSVFDQAKFGTEILHTSVGQW